MSNKTLIDEAKRLRNEATKVLKMTGLSEELCKYGKVHIVGSYEYNVMMAMDIDFHVLIPSFNEKLITNFFEYVVSLCLFEEIIFHDKHRFNKDAAIRYVSGKALDSYYFGLRMTFESNLWQIGVNFITQMQETSIEIGKLFENATDAQREIILQLKKSVKDVDAQVSSTYIYRAVLEKGITEESALFDYLSSIGYSV